MYKKFNTPEIEVPEDILYCNEKNKCKPIKTLTKKGNLSTRKGKKSIQLIPSENLDIKNQGEEVEYIKPVKGKKGKRNRTIKGTYDFDKLKSSLGTEEYEKKKDELDKIIKENKENEKEIKKFIQSYNDRLKKLQEKKEYKFLELYEVEKKALEEDSILKKKVNEIKDRLDKQYQRQDEVNDILRDLMTKIKQAPKILKEKQEVEYDDEKRKQRLGLPPKILKEKQEVEYDDEKKILKEIEDVKNELDDISKRAMEEREDSKRIKDSFIKEYEKELNKKKSPTERVKKMLYKKIVDEPMAIYYKSPEMLRKLEIYNRERELTDKLNSLDYLLKELRNKKSKIPESRQEIDDFDKINYKIERLKDSLELINDNIKKLDKAYDENEDYFKSFEKNMLNNWHKGQKERAKMSTKEETEMFNKNVKEVLNSFRKDYEKKRYDIRSKIFKLNEEKEVIEKEILQLEDQSFNFFGYDTKEELDERWNDFIDLVNEIKEQLEEDGEYKVNIKRDGYNLIVNTTGKNNKKITKKYSAKELYDKLDSVLMNDLTKELIGGYMYSGVIGGSKCGGGLRMRRRIRTPNKYLLSFY